MGVDPEAMMIFVPLMDSFFPSSEVIETSVLETKLA